MLQIGAGRGVTRVRVEGHKGAVVDAGREVAVGDCGWVGGWVGG